MTDAILYYFALYGTPALFAITAVGQFGFPVPTSILLLTAGALLSDGDLSLWPVFFWSLAGAVAGDHVGYAAGRFAAVGIRRQFDRWPAARTHLQKAEAFTRKWGDGSVFFSRWLVSPIGPYVNLTSGLALYPLYRFTLADIAGEVVWIGGYLLLGNMFAQSISEISGIVANAAWAIAAAITAAFLGWQLARRLRRIRARRKPAP
ncbi:DedA family protein [Oricola thermophila]|uniref:DedA family protein n=1 Tax=Oricola thermophila TaxID=2742145 RepID=A0A6N1VGC1_9HYPH|nr:DedA family protein [Oricola thermophila]QKV18027.1 DedA family protein [Oricola thermophila]